MATSGMAGQPLVPAGVALESDRIRKTPRRRLGYRVDRVDLYKFPHGVLQRYLVVRPGLTCHGCSWAYVVE
jgi:hypothetical protein